MATKNKKTQTEELQLSPEQQIMQAHINSLTKKIHAHQFEIDELMPSLNAYQQSLAKSLQNTETNSEEQE